MTNMVKRRKRDPMLPEAAEVEVAVAAEAGTADTAITLPRGRKSLTEAILDRSSV